MSANREFRVLYGDRAHLAERNASEPPDSSTLGVIYVAGVSYSGSTLLGHILGELEGTFYGGEIRNTWDRGIIHNRICTCNAAFCDCVFWRAVIDRLPLSTKESAPELSRLHHDAVRSPFGFPFRGMELKPSAGSDPGEAAFELATEELYAAVAGVAGVRQVVDSSKSPRYAALLARLRTLDLRVVHLVRDPRAVVYSLLRRGRFGHRGAFTRSMWWTRWNLAIERFRRSDVPYVRIRYEDLVEDPASSLEQVMGSLGLRTSVLPIDGRVVRLSAKHIVSGNRTRGETGNVVLRNDLEWVSNLSPGIQRTVRATTLPLLARYGYEERSRL